MKKYTNEEKRILNKLRKKARKVSEYRKYEVILAHMRGLTNVSIAKFTGLDRKTVATYINEYDTEGLKGLEDKRVTGRPTYLTKEQEEKLYDTIKNKVPNDVGFEGAKNWTAKIACLWVENEFGITYSVSGMLDMFHRLNLSYTRPTYVLAKADPIKQEQFKKDFEDVKRNHLYGDIEHILFEDESSIRDYQAIMKTWFPKGEQRIIKTYGKHESVKLTGIINYETGTVHVEECEKFDAQYFLSFLERVLKLYPNGKIVMVLDNSRVHHANLLKDFLQKNKRLKLMFLPPYSPKLNIIEGLWGWLKDTCINNVFFSKVYEIALAVRRFIKNINAEPFTIIDRLCVQL